MPIGIKSSGGGTTTLVATNSASNFTATLPDNTGTFVTTGSSAAVTPTMLTTQAQYTGFKNRIINGAMVIDQRNAGASINIPPNGFYTLDRYNCYNSQTNKATCQQNAGSVTPPAGFNNYLGITSSSAYSVVTGDYFTVIQAIEGLNIADLGWGTVNAKTITLSFQIYSSLTGTFGGSVSNGTRSYPFTYTISSANTWTQASVTIPGDTSGTWLKTNGLGMYVSLAYGAGSTYSGTAGSWSASQYWSATGATSVVGTNGATFYITGLQLEVGSVATSFDYRPYSTELALCQRYYEVIESFFNAYIAYKMGGPVFKVTKRAVPTATFIGNGGASGYMVESNSTGSNCPVTGYVATTDCISNINVTFGTTTNMSGTIKVGIEL